MKKNIYYIVTAILWIILIPIFIDWFIIGNNIPSNISNECWVGFLGSYLSSIVSIVGVFITIRYYKNKDKQDSIDRKYIIIEQIKKEYEIKYRLEYIENLNELYKEITRYKDVWVIISEAFLKQDLRSMFDMNERLNSIIKNMYYINNSMKINYKNKLSIFDEEGYNLNIEYEVDNVVTLFSIFNGVNCGEDFNDIIIWLFQEEIPYLKLPYKHVSDFIIWSNKIIEEINSSINKQKSKL